jgi:flavin-dependent dehydrogenase
MVESACDVLVIGGGPAGSATAAILARCGVRVTIIDRAHFPRAKPCGDYLNPGCDAVLARLGVRDSLIGAGAQPVRGMRVATPDGTALRLPFARSSGWALPRHTLDHLLLGHAARSGAVVIEDARVCGVEQVRHHAVVHAEHAGARRVSYVGRLVIGGDGRHSTAARMINGASAPLRGRYTVGAYLEGVAPASGGGQLGELHLGTHRYCGVAYLPGGQANVTIALSRPELRRWKGDMEYRYWETLRTFPDLADRVRSARRTGRFQTSGPLAYRRGRTASGRVLLVGDAAGHVDPMTGQGLFLALRGAELAAQAAQDALSGVVSAALRRYERAYRREFGSVFLMSRILQLLAFHPAAIRRATRRMAADPGLGARLIGAVGNVEPSGSALRPGFVARILGIL